MADTEQPMHYYVCLYTHNKVLSKNLLLGNFITSLNHSGQALDCSWATAGCSKEVHVSLVSLVTDIQKHLICMYIVFIMERVKILQVKNM
jgi:hypothetical protein